MNKDEMTLESIIFGLKAELAEKRAEIERLTEEYEDKVAWQEVDIQQLTEEKAELQEQVDTKTEHLEKALDEIDRLKVAHSQAVKDTAKEIIRWIKLNGILEYGGYVIHDSTIEQMCKKFGVEVE